MEKDDPAPLVAQESYQKEVRVQRDSQGSNENSSSHTQEVQENSYQLFDEMEDSPALIINAGVEPAVLSNTIVSPA